MFSRSIGDNACGCSNSPVFHINPCYIYREVICVAAQQPVDLYCKRDLEFIFDI